MLAAVPLIYLTTPENDRGLRDQVVAFGAKHVEQRHAFEELKAATSQTPEYMIEVAIKRGEKDEKWKPYEKHYKTCSSDQKWKYVRALCGCGRYKFLEPEEMSLAT